MKLPLQNKRVLITRPKSQAASFIKLLKKEGAIPILLPVFEITEMSDTSLIKREMNQIETYDTIIFTSTKAVDFFFKYFEKNNLNLKVVVIGSKTAAALKKYNVNADFIPEKFAGADMTNELDVKKVEKILYPCSSLSTGEIKNGLEAKGATVKVLPIYHNKFISPLAEQIKTAFAQKIDFITFTSGSAVKGFLKIKKEVDKQTKIVCIGPSTAKAAKEAGMKIDAIAEPHTIEGMIATMKKIQHND